MNLLHCNNFRVFGVLALCLCCGACVAVPEGFDGGAAQGRAFEAPALGLDPGHKTEETAHFRLSAYSSSSSALYAALCEENYTRIMQDLGIYSFVPARPYNVSVYRDAAEYRLKTGQPEWSGGAAYGNALLLYEGPGLRAAMAHEMTHLVFNEFMGLAQAAQLRWLNEGVAVYEESRSSQDSTAFYAQKVSEAVVPNPIPFSQLVNLAPQGESLKTVDRWYAQAGSVAGFMIRAGGSFNFSLFLAKLRDGASVDQAIESAYFGLWKKLADVERAWLLEVKR
ncbi:MAG: hypothetical protein A2234_00990 [Elusimicrobia bacterium RIFOXYA2_FULL_58_8]|nr:MAG: hypothetical protein A2234_00990 [Elusimicrobia bacterium RIFOXYA2_FULL_58_8]OGS14291.1 MAG: hypothetical protein A2285_00505 [Elusimicrobia bacterium RIFOXYA12_FULL_57_11]